MSSVTLNHDPQLVPRRATIIRGGESGPGTRFVDDRDVRSVCGHRQFRFIADTLRGDRLDGKGATLVSRSSQPKPRDATWTRGLIVHVRDVDRSLRINGHPLVAMK